MNKLRKFDLKQKEALGNYIYALMDPRDSKVFYIDQGQGDRVFDHFSETDEANKTQKWSAKTRRIIEIWEDDKDVDIHILRRGLLKSELNHAEATAISALSISQNGALLNKQDGNNLAKHGSLNIDDLRALTAKDLVPKIDIEALFIFPISKGIETYETVYEATRQAWKVSETNSAIKNSYAIGVSSGISKGAFKIDSWEKWPESEGLSMFVKEDVKLSDWVNKSLKTIISGAMGYWQRGNYLIIEIKDKQFRYRYGNSDKESWFSLSASE